VANLRVERGDRAGCQYSLAGRTLIYTEMMREVDGLSEGGFPESDSFLLEPVVWVVWPIAVYCTSPPAPER
jgi:hypothetical protein